ncbi:MAG: hypothetical protein JOY70_09210 [Acidisphaera sp.]|nr:hypothetical protein [Acidisphaera sp.]MBV9812746.1 hypothetical protein [Acetobacteraceae bacterium]
MVPLAPRYGARPKGGHPMAAFSAAFARHRVTEAARTWSLPLASIRRFCAAFAERSRCSQERAMLRQMDHHMRADLGHARVFEEMNKRDGRG